MPALGEQFLLDTLEDPARGNKLRMSESGACPRYRYLLATGEELPQADLATLGRWQRGRDVEARAIEMLKTEYPKWELIEQYVVPSPRPSILANGHLDAAVFPAVLREPRKGWEFKSYAGDGGSIPYEADIEQACAYVNFSELEQVDLVYVSADDLSWRVFPIGKNGATKQRLLEQIDSIARALEVGDLDLIDRPTAGPLEEPCLRQFGRRSVPCPFVSICWGDWQAERTEVAEGKIAELVEHYVETEHALKRTKAGAAEIEAKRDGLRDVLRPVLKDKGNRLAIAGFELKRTEVNGRISYPAARLRKAEQAGVIDLDTLEPWRNVGEPYERWTVRGRE